MRQLLALVLVSVLATPTANAQAPNTAQESTDAWLVIQALPAGARVALTTNDGATITGRVIEAFPDGVTIEEEQGRQSTQRRIARANIVSVKVLTMPSPPQKPRLSAGDKAQIAIWSGVGVLVVLGVWAARRSQ